MSKSGTKNPDPNATIQLDAIDALDHVDLDAPAAAAEDRPGTRPPPLPPQVPTVRPAAGQSSTRMLAYGVAFLVLLGVAVAAGVGVGSYARARQAPLPSTSAAAVISPRSVTTASAVPSTSASPHEFTIPTVEMGGHQ